MRYSHNKMLRYLFVALLFAPVLGFAQPLNQTDATGKKQGNWKKYDTEGKLKYEGQFKDNKPYGKFTYYYPSGKLKAESVFSADGSVARNKTYSEDSTKLMAVGKYVNEKKDSIWTYYNNAGTVVATETYAKGIKTGTWKNFYPGGKLLEIKTYKNNLLEGPWEQYFEDGSLRTKATYVKDKLNGIAVYYQGKNLKVAEGRFVNGVRDGGWIYYTPDGKIEKTEKYSKGQLIGEPELKKDPKEKGTRPPAKEEP